MKKLNLLLAVLLMAFTASSQNDANLTKTNWKVGATRVINGYKILKEQGQSKYGMVNIGYESLQDLIDETEKKASDQMWTEEKKNETLDMYRTIAPGGIITLYITGITINTANTKWYSVIVKDSTDTKEILRTKLGDDIPEVPSGQYGDWWNFGFTYVSQPVEFPFFVYVTSELASDDDKAYKFKIVGLDPKSKKKS